MERDGSSGSRPRGDPRVPARRCGIVPGTEPNSPVNPGLSEAESGSPVLGGDGVSHSNSSHFLLLQNWLTESAKLIAQSGQTVEWVTPLGLPIVQPYYRSRPTVVSVWCAGITHPFLCRVRSRERTAMLQAGSSSPAGRHQGGSACAGTSCRAWSGWVLLRKRCCSHPTQAAEARAHSLLPGAFPGLL